MGESHSQDSLLQPIKGSHVNVIISGVRINCVAQTGAYEAAIALVE